MYRSVSLVALLACFTVGCSTTADVALNPDAPQDIKSVVVLAFDESQVSDQAADRAVVGHTAETGAGRVVSKMLAQGFEERGPYKVLRGADLSAACVRQNLSLDELPRMDPEKIGQKLGVDGVIKGRVHAFRQSWALFASRAVVSFRAACYHVRAQKVAWNARAEGTRLGGLEADLALEASRTMAKRLSANVASRKPAKQP